MRKDWKGARTFRLRQTTIARLDALTKEYEAFSSDIVDLLLERGLEKIDAGEWALNARPVKFEIDWISQKEEISA